MNDDVAHAVEAVVSQFDFARVQRAMAALDWKWGTPGSTGEAVPTIAQLENTARHLLQHAWEENDENTMECAGGFEACRSGNTLVLRFVLETQSAEAPSRPFAPAPRLWKSIPETHREQLLNNVFCGRCRASMRIVNFTGTPEESGGLVLRGFCADCGSPVVRVIEPS